MGSINACRCDGTGNWIGPALTVSIDRSRYPDGYMPLAKWTRKNTVAALRACCRMFDMRFDENLVDGMDEAELKDRFIEFKHRVRSGDGKYGVREYDAYGIDEDALDEAFRPLTGSELKEKKSRARYIPENGLPRCRKNRGWEKRRQEYEREQRAYAAWQVYRRYHGPDLFERAEAEYREERRRIERERDEAHFREIRDLYTVYERKKPENRDEASEAALSVPRAAIPTAPTDTQPARYVLIDPANGNGRIPDGMIGRTFSTESGVRPTRGKIGDFISGFFSSLGKSRP